MLVDTNVLLRNAQPHNGQYAIAKAALQLLPEQGKILYITQQNLVEFWVVATRPYGVNGLG